MSSYPDPNQAPAEGLPVGEPEYREYSSARPQRRAPGYPATPAFPARYPPVAARPMPPVPVPPAQAGGQPYPYGPARQAFQPVTPQPMSPFPVTKKNSRGWILILSIIGVAIIILAAVLIYAFSTISSSSPNTTNIIITPGANGGTSQPGLVSLGQSITVSGLTATVLSVEPLTGDGTINPAAGNTYEIVNVRLQNTQNTSLLYSPSDFHVFNGDNQERDVEVIVPDTYTANQQLPEGSLDPNSSVRGDVIIQVPRNDHNVKLGWSPAGVTSDSKYEWNLGL